MTSQLGQYSPSWIGLPHSVWTNRIGSPALADGRVFVPPIREPVQQRQDVGARFGEPVLMACATHPLVWQPRHQPKLHQPAGRADITSSATPRSAPNWSKRVIPTLAFFRISNVHLSASTSTARVIGQCASEIGLLAIGTSFL